MTTSNQPDTFVDPVCGMSVDPATAAAKTCHDGVEVYFCAQGCKQAFEALPENYPGTRKKKGFWKRYLDRLNKALGGHKMKNRKSFYELIIVAAIVGLAGLAFAGGGMMGGGGGYGGGMMGGGSGYGHGMMGNGNGYDRGRMGNGYGSGYGMMNQGRGYGDRMGNDGYGNRSREDSERMQQSGSRFDESTRGLRNDIRDKQAALQNEMDKAAPDRDKVHRLQRELSQLRAEYDRKALDFQLQNR